MGKPTVKKADYKATSLPNDVNALVTPKGNKLYIFSDVSASERNSLRISTYSYLI